MRLRWQRSTVDTKFHIDLDWWVRNDRDIRVHLRDLLCDECKSRYFDAFLSLGEIDWLTWRRARSRA